MKHISPTLLATALLFGGLNAQAGTVLTEAEQSAARDAALEVINGFMGDAPGRPNVVLDLTLDKSDKDCDKFGYEYVDGTLTIHASSGVAACRAFYEWTKANGAGISTWSANRFEMPDQITKTNQATFTSPYRDHQYYNVVTYGYSTPYWDAARWDQEIDWMALHGIDMPLMLVGSEGIYFDVFTKDFGLPAADVHNWEVGPCHLPWMRMGNLAGSKFDGPLDEHWYEQQKQLAHHILRRMKALGMKPVCPAFGGFVPPTFAQYNKGATLTKTGWDWVISRGESNTRLNPDSEHFVNVGKAFIKRWEAEFGESYPDMKYYLSDSFNEMKVPGAAELKTYGNNIYRSIAEGSKNPDAVWVTQGWEFVYGAGKWTDGTTRSEKFKALTDGVPDHRMMVLYMSPEYGGYGNKTWETYENFNGKEWNYTMLPNMGGKNFYTGCLNDYAQTFPKNLSGSTGKNNCTGWGMTMEGIEYNEMLYELIADMGWTDPAKGKTVSTWVTQYGKARYGDYTAAIKNLHTALRNSVYTKYKDHQTFGWQGYNRTTGYYTPGNIDYVNDTYYKGVEDFFNDANVEALKSKPLSATLRADIIEFAAFYAAARIENINKRIVTLKNSGKRDEARALVADLEKVMRHMDRALSGHPLYDLQKWEDKAVKAAGNDAQRQKQYVRDARSIVSTWHSAHGSAADAHEPVNDYAGRIWAGLIRGYYMPRLLTELNGLIDGKSVNLRTIENNFVSTTKGTALPPVLELDAEGKWVESAPFTDATPDAELIDFLAQLVKDAKEAGKFVVEKNEVQLSTDAESHWYYVHSNNPSYLEYAITVDGSLASLTTSVKAKNLDGSNAQIWRFIDNGDGTVRMENREGLSFSWEGTAAKTYIANIASDLKLEYDKDNVRYVLIPQGATKGVNLSKADGTLQTASYKTTSSYTAASTWTLADASGNIEVASDEDRARISRRISGFRPDVWGDASLYGRLGQPKNAAAIDAAVKALSQRDLALETYTQYLAKYDNVLRDNFNIPTTPEQQKLFRLILSVFQMNPASNANESAQAELRAALIEAQRALADNISADDATAQTKKLEAAAKAFIEGAASFPYVSLPPKDGKFRASSRIVTIKVKNAGYLTTDNMQNSAFRLDNATRPTTEAGYWIVSGDDGQGYTFYNVGKGAKYVLGFSGSEGSARAKFYSATTTSTTSTRKFFYRTNDNGEPVFVLSGNNAWNNFGGQKWLALWNNANALKTDAGSALIIEEVEDFDLGVDETEAIHFVHADNPIPQASNTPKNYDLQGRRSSSSLPIIITEGKKILR